MTCSVMITTHCSHVFFIFTYKLVKCNKYVNSYYLELTKHLLLRTSVFAFGYVFELNYGSLITAQKMHVNYYFIAEGGFPLWSERNFNKLRIMKISQLMRFVCISYYVHIYHIYCNASQLPAGRIHVLVLRKEQLTYKRTGLPENISYLLSL